MTQNWVTWIWTGYLNSDTKLILKSRQDIKQWIKIESYESEQGYQTMTKNGVFNLDRILNSDTKWRLQSGQDITKWHKMCLESGQDIKQTNWVSNRDMTLESENKNSVTNLDRILKCDTKYRLQSGQILNNDTKLCLEYWQNIEQWHQMESRIWGH